MARSRRGDRFLGGGVKPDVAASLSLPLLSAPKAQGRVIGGHRPSIGTHEAIPGQKRPERSKAASRAPQAGEREPPETQTHRYGSAPINSNAISARDIAFPATWSCVQSVRPGARLDSAPAPPYRRGMTIQPSDSILIVDFRSEQHTSELQSLM